ncbi:hypothetical protein [Fibrivirga algicola]|uniref:Uncharacterized protein n=1 Tax=Fibrivirga algicola TaxID=2950420 RepID=A0ABX0QAV7_9BACT|nr:hypothetical protein [Fibrivirga algicola]NID09154.1 hypothetical protein [Fibrivirga algicola]
MTRLLFSLCFMLITLLSACTKTTVDPAAPTETAQARQARQWLTAQPKWVVAKASQNNSVYYERGVQQVGEVDMEVEWLRFLTDNRFEVQLLGEAKPQALFYKIDNTTNDLIVSETADFKKPLNWATKIDNIREKSVDLFIREGSDDLVTLTLVPQTN